MCCRSHSTRRSPDLHLAKIGVRLADCEPDQASYIGVSKDGPFKGDHYRY